MSVKDNLKELILSFCHVGPLMSGLGSKCLYLLSHLSGSLSWYHIKEPMLSSKEYMRTTSPHLYPKASRSRRFHFDPGSVALR